MNPCSDCGAPCRGSRCSRCWRLFDEERGPRIGPLPAREPEPESVRFCGCGAMRELVTFRGETRCADCWRGGVPRNVRAG